MAGAGKHVIAGTERALEMLRSLPRLALDNIKGDKKRQVTQSDSFSVSFEC